MINKFNFTQDAMIRQAERISQNQNQTVKNTQGAQNVQGQSFRQMLDNSIAQNSISFSKHASMRTEQRNIDITGVEMEKLQAACDKATQKGIKDALVVMNDSAFIVNTPNRVVITVVDKNEMKENIFTHIDGALFI